MSFESCEDGFGHVLHGDGATITTVFDNHDVESLIAHHGVLVLRGFSDGAAGFEEVTDRLGRVRPANIRSGTTREFSSTRGTQAVNAGQQALPLHAESYYTPICPQILSFACVSHTADGGATTVCDGVALFRALSPAARRALLECDVVWRHSCPAEELEAQTQRPLSEFVAWCGNADRCEVTVDDSTRRIRIDYRAPAIRRTRWSNLEAFANNLIPLDRAGLLEEMAPGLSPDVVREAQAVAEELIVPHKWLPDDVLLIDNTRVMHGRTGWSTGNRRILARMLTVDAAPDARFSALC